MTDLEPPQNRESRIQDEDAFSSMDRMYRYQRYFYNVTRKYYLLGRDKLLSEMDVQSGENVLEIGCGTGRNLAILAKRLPNAHFFGLDASAAMLETAAETVARSNLTNITLKTALADSFSCDKTFELDQPFDAVFFSYSISMIPPWRESIENALKNLKPGGTLYIVDFYDQRDLPKFFQKMLKGWLRQFHVQFWDDLLPFFKCLENKSLGELQITPIYRRYAFCLSFRKAE
jgi:S-adenosylmethionine-diacylgycerolhomoserine-N-methlytransferase